MSLIVSSWDNWENMVVQMIFVLTFGLRDSLSPRKYTGKVLKPKNEGVGTLWLTKCLCHLGTGICTIRWPIDTVRDRSKTFLDSNA